MRKPEGAVRYASGGDEGHISTNDVSGTASTGSLPWASARSVDARRPRQCGPLTLARFQWLLPAVVIAATLVSVWVYGSTTHFILCLQDCGEVFDALQYVDNYRLYGFKYGLLQDYATSGGLEGHPYFYSHNVNLAGIIFTFLEAAGLRPFWSKQLTTLTVFGAGLFYVFRATAYYSRSWLAGLVVLLLFATDIDHVLAFSLNPLRVWHWLTIFGLVYHVGRLARQPGRAPYLDRVVIVLLACAAFGIGYDFWVTCSGIAAAIYVLCRGRRAFLLGTVVGLFGLVVTFVVPFVLRQIQVAAVLGPSFWFMDVVYSAAIKVSVLSRVIQVPPASELDAIYQAAGVHRPPASPTSTLAAIFGTLADMVHYIVVPSYGTLSIFLAVVVMLCSLVGAALLFVACPRRLVQVFARCGVIGARRAGLVGSVRMMSALTAAMLGGLAFFAPLSLHIYLKHEFPLVVMPVLMTKGIAIASCISVFWHLRGRRSAASIMSISVAVFLMFDHAFMQTETVRSRQPIALDWIPAVAARQESTFAVSWIPGAVSVFTDRWAAGVPPGKEREVADRFAAGRPLFNLSDYFLFGERDAEQNAQVYAQPDYWLYFQTEHPHMFDARRPVCRQDYLGTVLSRVRGGSDTLSLMDRLYAQPGQARPGSIVTFGARIARTMAPGMSAELLHQGRVVATLNYNCMTGVILGEFQVPTGSMSGMQQFTGRLVRPNGQTFSLGEIGLMVADSPMPSPPRLPSAGPPQPDADEMVRLFPGLTVAERGPDFVIFDLRPLYGGP